MLVESVILSILLGILSGKKLKSLENIKINRLWLIFLSFFIESICTFIIKNNIQPFALFISKNYLIIHILIYMFLFIFFAFNLNSKYLRLMLVGVILNFIVIAANKGFMPVSVDMASFKGFNEGINMLADGKIAGHTLLVKGTTRFWFLADIINIPPPYPFPQTISLGDIFIAVGTFLFIQFNMRFNQQNRQNS